MASNDQPAARSYGRERFEATHDPQDFLRWLNAYVNETGREDHELHALCSHAHSVIAALQNEIAALLPHAQGAAMPGSEHPAAMKLDDALADVESYIVNGGYETIFDGKERHTVLMDRRKALAALSEVKNVLRGDGHHV